jgi:formate dehydrogenase
MTPHYSGTTLDAQSRYANGARLILENYFAGKPQQAKDIIAGSFSFQLV